MALDRIGYDWVIEARREKGVPPFGVVEGRTAEIEGTPPAYIATAAARGLGTDDLRKLDLVEVEIPSG